MRIIGDTIRTRMRAERDNPATARFDRLIDTCSGMLVGWPVNLTPDGLARAAIEVWPQSLGVEALANEACRRVEHSLRDSEMEQLRQLDSPDRQAEAAIKAYLLLRVSGKITS